MTDQGITEEELRALCAAATPAPWGLRTVDDGEFYGQPATFDVVTIDGDREEKVAAGGPVEDGGPVLGASEGPDAEFIAAARTAVPALLAEVVRLRGVVQLMIEAAESTARRIPSPFAHNVVFAVRGAAEGLPVPTDTPEREPRKARHADPNAHVAKRRREYLARAAVPTDEDTR